MSIPIEDLEDGQPAKDFRRANGAPMVHKPDGSGKWDRYSRPSSMGSDLDDESNLTNWRIDRAMDGVAMNPSLAAAIVAKQGIKEGRKELREQAITKGRGEEAADLGTALHAITERYEQEPGFRVPAPYDGDVAAYIAALDRAGLVSEHIEVKICSDQWRAAGTADRIYRATKTITITGWPAIEPGQLVLGDLKTGARLDYSFRAYAVQTAVYVDGCFYDVDTNERTPFPNELRTDLALLVHLPVGEARCELHWVDLEIGRHGASLVKQVRDWRKRTDHIFDFSFDEVDIVAEMQEIAATVPEGIVTAPTNDDEWLDHMIPFAQQRINVLGRYANEARTMLLRRWPEGVQPLKAQRPTPEGMTAILDVLDAIEALYSVPWSEDDPRVQWNRGLHRSEVDRSNQPPSYGATNHEQ